MNSFSVGVDATVSQSDENQTKCFNWRNGKELDAFYLLLIGSAHWLIFRSVCIMVTYAKNEERFCYSEQLLPSLTRDLNHKHSHICSALIGCELITLAL